jgi:hypothetical protein
MEGQNPSLTKKAVAKQYQRLALAPLYLRQLGKNCAHIVAAK